MRIGIFGGTFDPPHEGHKKYVEEVFECLNLDRMIVIPTFIPPHKASDDTADCKDRMRMAQLAFESDSRVFVSDIEIIRQGKSYTFDTVRELSQQYKDDELFFLMGSDMLLSFHNWWKPEEIIKYVKICAVSRDENESATELLSYVEKMFPKDKDRFVICSFEPLDISSTEIREKIRLGEELKGLVNERVIDYIKEKELYL